MKLTGWEGNRVADNKLPQRKTSLLREKIQRSFPEMQRDLNLQIKRLHDVPGNSDTHSQPL